MTDLISREAAIQAALLGASEYCGYHNQSLSEEIRKKINNLPSQWPQTDTVVTIDTDKLFAAIDAVSDKVKGMQMAMKVALLPGKWVPEPDRRNHWHCSRCGYVIGAMKVDAKYCLNCGCQMLKGEDDERT